MSDDHRMLVELDKLILQRQRKAIDGMYNRACNLRDACPNGQVGAEQYEVLDTEYGRQYRRAWKRGLVASFRAQTRSFRKWFRRRPRP